jgi:LysR family glycine cleavage system transcriptional activator
VRFSNAALAFQAAKVGIGVAIAQYPYVKRELTSGELVAPFPDPVTTEMGYYLVSHKIRHERANVRKFRQWLLSLNV